jgi:voltage-gated potassium channel Kch
VVDFNPLVIERLRQRGIRVTYGDISQRETLHHAAISHAQVIVCTLPDTILKGTTNRTLIRQVRELNPAATIIATTDSLGAVDDLYAAGADYVQVPRLSAAAELGAVLAGVFKGALPLKRIDQDARLADRNEILS